MEVFEAWPGLAGTAVEKTRRSIRKQDITVITTNFLISEEGKPTAKLGRKAMGLPIEECQVTSLKRIVAYLTH